MKNHETHKPEFEEWLYWAQVVGDRLSICVNVYSHPPYEDIFMPEKDRQHRNFQTIDLLKRIEAATDETDTPSDSLTELNHHAERVIDALAMLFAETLRHLPQLSRDMQRLLKSPWQSKFPSRLAENLFRGPLASEDEGIGSGLPEHGRLPGILQTLLKREEKGENRALRQEIMGKHALSPDLARRWTELNSRSLRSAGRIE
jgi:hypothetical protein